MELLIETCPSWRGSGTQCGATALCSRALNVNNVRVGTWFALKSQSILLCLTILHLCFAKLSWPYPLERQLIGYLRARAQITYFV